MPPSSSIRCVLPLCGLYEWDQWEPKPWPRYRIHLEGEPVMLLGGLWSNENQPACTILTTGAGEAVEPLHTRRPVLVPGENLGWWLDPGVRERGTLEDLMLPVGGLAVEPG